MANIRTRTDKDGKSYHTVQIRLKGYPPQTATFKRLTDAKKWAQDTESAIREGRHFKTVEAKKHTVAEMLDKYCDEYLPNNKEKTYSLKELVERKSRMAWWKSKIGHTLLSEITPPMIDEQISNMSQSAATVDKYLKNLSHAFSIAIKKWGWTTENPCKKVTSPTLPRGRVRYLNDEERERFLQACKESSNSILYTCVVLAISTGMRQSELMKLQWQDINLKDGYLILHETKNGERRRVPIEGHALELLQEHAKIRRLDTDLLFPGNIHKDKAIDLRKPFENAVERAGIVNFHWHDLRHCTASYLVMNGASLAEIAEVLGHKTLAMVKRYAHLSDSHVANVVASMNNKIFGISE